MNNFDGFPHGQFSRLPLPPGFFTALLPLIDDLNELKLTLFCLHAMGQRPNGAVPYLRHRQLMSDTSLRASLSPEALDDALARCIARGTLLRVEVTLDDAPEPLYFVNTPRGRSAVQQVQRGQWRPAEEDEVEILPERPNVYTLYEQNIGPLTAHIANELRDAEAEFSAQWLEEAIKIAVENNKRNWRYVRAILNRWKNEGRYHETPARPNLEDGKRFVGGKYADFIES